MEEGSSIEGTTIPPIIAPADITYIINNIESGLANNADILAAIIAAVAAYQSSHPPAGKSLMAHDGQVITAHNHAALVLTNVNTDDEFTIVGNSVIMPAAKVTLATLNIDNLTEATPSAGTIYLYTLITGSDATIVDSILSVSYPASAYPMMLWQWHSVGVSPGDIGRAAPEIGISGGVAVGTGPYALSYHIYNDLAVSVTFDTVKAQILRMG